MVQGQCIDPAMSQFFGRLLPAHSPTACSAVFNSPGNQVGSSGERLGSEKGSRLVGGQTSTQLH